MICENCGKNTGTVNRDSLGKVLGIKYISKINICTKCKAEFCEECFPNLTSCPCCGKNITK